MAKRGKSSLVGRLQDKATDLAGAAVDKALDVAEYAMDLAQGKTDEPGHASASMTFSPAVKPLITRATRASDWSKGQPYRILSMDGAAGVLQYVRLLREIVKSEYEKDPANFVGFLRHIHMLTGNSGGTLTAVYLAARLNTLGHPPSGKEEVAILDDLVQFTDEFFRVSAGGVDAVKRSIQGKQASCPTDALRDFLERSYGTLQLADCQTPALNILSFRMYNGSGPQNFFSPALTDATSNAESNPSLVELALRSSAFPVCLSMIQGHVDGALVANNPSMQTICRLRAASRKGDPAFLQDLRLDDIKLLSLGAENGKLDQNIDWDRDTNGLPKDKDWGWRPWIGPLVKDIFDKPHSPDELLALVKRLKDEAPQVMLFGELFCDGDGRGIFEACRHLLGDDVTFRLAPPTTHGLVIDGLLWLLGTVDDSLDSAEQRAKVWRAAPNDESLGMSFNQTLAWLNEQWWG